MKNELEKQHNSIFEQIKRIDETGMEYWSARDLAKVLEYSEYRHFLPVIERAKEACINNGLNIPDHFENVLDMVEIGSGAKRKLESIKLSYYACCLIVENADSSKIKKTNADAYFFDNKGFVSSDNPVQQQLSLKDELSSFLLYTTPEGGIKVEAILAEETVWLTQENMSQIFDVQLPAVSKHLKNIFESGELEKGRCISILETHLPDGRIYNVKYYNLDAIISVGYRVNSSRATQFRIWATTILKEYIIKGFTMDDYRMKNGQYFGKDYFQELLERIRSIRSSERRIRMRLKGEFCQAMSK